jgi:NAD-dependent dihydropyrimidine dehydrogenase PreA subunit
VTYVIAEPCIDVVDRACVDECPVDCIYEGERALYIHPDECIDCGACEPVCPVEAIFYEDDLPKRWAEYRTVTATAHPVPIHDRSADQAGLRPSSPGRRLPGTRRPCRVEPQSRRRRAQGVAGAASPGDLGLCGA